MKLYNSLTRKIEEFVPLREGKVGMYTCGPTVYGPGHLGHARSYVTFDLLKRAFLYQGYKVTHVLNITDVHDDMIKKAVEEGITIFQLAEKYLPLFKKDLSDLNILPADVYPRVTEHIKEIIEMVKILVEKGYAYVEKDGVYFDVSKFRDYGKLSGRKLEEAKTGTRVQTDKYEKDEASDFALWKRVLASQGSTLQNQASWDSPWGKGRPGWHIECSVMSRKYLGQPFDLHAGAMDLKFPHHENEIAQSEAAYGVKLANYWFHGGLLKINGQKMSKSLKNYLEIHEIVEKGYDPLALRYLILTVGYRDELNFTWEGLKGAQKALNNLREIVGNLKLISKTESSVSPEKVAQRDSYRQRFLNYLNNDLAIPQALALVWEVVKSQLPAAEKLDLVLDFDNVLGLNLSNGSTSLTTSLTNLGIPEEIKKLAVKREQLRKEKNFEEADLVRKEIEEKGYAVEDTSSGSMVHPSS